MTSVVVVVLSWNKQHAVIECIDRVKTLSGADVRIVVVDNASADDSVDAIARAHPDVTILRESTNRGFAGGVNRGLDEAARRGADYAWLLNDDTHFDSTVLAPLIGFATANPGCGLLSPTLVDLGTDAAPQFVNGMVDWNTGTMGHNFPPAAYERRVAGGATPIVAGTALLCDLRVLRAIGPFDERFFAYWEDTDYAVRAARAGFSSAVVPTVTLEHAAPRASDRPPHYHYYMTRNEALFWRLHAKPSTRWKRRWLSASLATIGRERDLDHPANVQATTDAIWHAWTRRYGARNFDAPAPRWFSRLLLAAPNLLCSIVQGRWRSIVMRGRNAA